jgi:hypothetical protein
MKLKRTAENTMMYLCAYYGLKKLGEFRDSAINFPSHVKIVDKLSSLTNLPRSTPLSEMMDKLGLPYSVAVWNQYKSKKRKNKKMPVDPTKTKVEVNKSFVIKDDFLKSDKWRTIRYRALELQGGACQCCGRSRKSHGVILHVDHIKPRSKFPELALNINNLQILCEDCNLGKSNKFDTDWR